MKEIKLRRGYGVRNYQACNFMRDGMKIGDLAFFYHSHCKELSIAGIVEIVRESYPDLTALDPNDHHYDLQSTLDNPRWLMVDVKFQKKFPKIISLQALHQNPIIVRKGNRLFITPVSKSDWDWIMKILERKDHHK